MSTKLHFLNEQCQLNFLFSMFNINYSKLKLPCHILHNRKVNWSHHIILGHIIYKRESKMAKITPECGLTSLADDARYRL